jgi:hypothetical protein
MIEINASALIAPIQSSNEPSIVGLAEFVDAEDVERGALELLKSDSQQGERSKNNSADVVIQAGEAEGTSLKKGEEPNEVEQAYNNSGVESQDSDDESMTLAIDEEQANKEKKHKWTDRFSGRCGRSHAGRKS